ncbi:MAG TPA: DinB family protein [Gemmatimonadales bacterium]|nr:DinB family protein [Gemmatimonadales bacterium]
MTRRSGDWQALAEDHHAALGQFLATARRIPPQSWTTPVAPGKWSPADITSHLAQSYRVLRAELAGGKGMAIRLPYWQRWILRRRVLPGILAGKGFPPNAGAPKETRPRDNLTDAREALRILADEAEGFAQDVAARASSERVRLTHAYFGAMSARQSLQLATVHTRHHAHQLERIPREIAG